MYKKKPAFVYGFHGMDESSAYKIVNQKEEFKQSDNLYDWLGKGTYFWENNLERAKQYAIEDSQRTNTKINNPFALGAVIDLGNCLDLLEQDYLDFLKMSYNEFNKEFEGISLPRNTGFAPNDFDFRKRELDCAVIRWAHTLAAKEGIYFDTVRAAFWEGEELYPNAGFKMQNHIQIAVLNPNCIKGIFLPRDEVEFP
ncbi:MAG: hypothetical protein ACI86H_002067 [bacterium]|jgi:hypothetical protein